MGGGPSVIFVIRPALIFCDCLDAVRIRRWKGLSFAHQRVRYMCQRSCFVSTNLEGDRCHTEANAYCAASTMKSLSRDMTPRNPSLGKLDRTTECHEPNCQRKRLNPGRRRKCKAGRAEKLRDADCVKLRLSVDRMVELETDDDCKGK